MYNLAMIEQKACELLIGTAPAKRTLSDLKRAIEESKRSLADEQTRAAEERDLQRAIKLSEEEEARRNKSVEDSNSRSLFDDSQP